MPDIIIEHKENDTTPVPETPPAAPKKPMDMKLKLQALVYNLRAKWDSLGKGGSNKKIFVLLGAMGFLVLILLLTAVVGNARKNASKQPQKQTATTPTPFPFEGSGGSNIDEGGEGFLENKINEIQNKVNTIELKESQLFEPEFRFKINF